MKKFRNVNLPRILVDEIENIIKNPSVTHNTIASFVEYAVRKHIEKTKQDIIEEQKWQDHLEIAGIKEKPKNG